MKLPFRMNSKSHVLPLLLVTLCFLATLGVWHQFQKVESQQIQQIVRGDTLAVRVAIEKGLKNRILALERMANRLEYGAETRAEWEHDAKAYLKDYPSLERLQWIDAKGNARWNLNSNSDADACQLSAERGRQLQNRQIQLHFEIDPVGQNRQFCAYIPLFPAGQFDGFLLSAFAAEPALDSLLANVGFKQAKYKIAIFDNAELLYQYVPPQKKARLNIHGSHPGQWTQRSRLDLYGSQWQVAVTPMPVLLAQLHSYLSESALVGGLVTAGIVVSLAYFAQSKIASNKELEQRVRERTVALWESEQRFRAILDNTASVVYLKDGQGRYILVNRRFLEIFNLTESEILGKCDRDLFPVDVAKAFVANDRRVLETGTVLNIEEEAQLSNGERRTYISIKAPLCDESGSPYAVCGISTDITARKRVELALRESEKRFRTLADSAPVLIWMSGTNQERTYVNQPWLHFTGRALEGELGNGWLEGVHPEDIEFYRDTYTTCFEARLPFELEYRLQCNDGEYAWILDTATPRFNPNGEFVGYIGSCIFITERKKAQLELQQLNQTLEERVRKRTAQLQESEAKFRNLVESSQDLIWSVDALGRFTFVNPAVRQIYGYEPEELLGRPFSELVLPEQRDRDSAIFERLMSGEIQTLCQYETIHRAKDGCSIALLFNAIPVRDESGKIVGTTGTATDITQRKQDEERLRILERAIDASANGIVVTDPNAADNPIVYVNSGFEQLTGYSEAEVVGRNCRFLHGDESEQEGLLELRKAVRDRRGCRVVLQNYRKDGKTFWNQLTISPVLDPEGRVSHFVGIQVDISDRLEIEEALRRNEALLLAINQVLPLGIYVANYQDDCILFYNRQFRRLWQIEGIKKENLSHSEVIERCLVQMQPDTESPFAVCNPISTVEDELKLEDGRILRRLHVPVQNGDRQFGHLSVFEDISDRKRGELELKQLNQQLRHSNVELERARANAEAANLAKSDFLAKMTHELRTPMNAILGFAQVLLRNGNLNATQQQQLHIIASSGEHLLELINDILDMSKIEAGRIELNPTDFDLYNLLNSLEQMLQLKARAKGLHLEFVIDRDIPQHIYADGKKLHQVLINLLGNAIKFTETGSVMLRVSCSVNSNQLSVNSNRRDQERMTNDQGQMTNDQGQIHFEVRDTGRGIAPEELERLFEAFTQSEAGRIAQEEGTGLGLTISRNFVELMGGQLQIDSTLGAGTSARFSIPVDWVPTGAIAQRQTSKRIVRLAPGQPEYRILVVEDRWENRQLVLQLLSPLGFTVLEATNGREGIALWEQHDPQLILMDLRMPVMDGYQAIQSIKATPKGQTTPIIALTASAFDEERQFLLSMGCDDYIRKPFFAEELLEKIGECAGTQYLYEAAELTPAIAPAPAPSKPLDRDALQAMPEEWREVLYEAATACNSKIVRQLLAAIPEENATLRQELMALATDYHFHTIAAIAHRSQENPSRSQIR